LEQRVARFFPQAARQPRVRQYGHIAVIDGRAYDLAETIERDNAQAVLAISQAGVATSTEARRSNIYTFCRMLRQALAILNERKAAAERQLKQGSHGGRV
jgi:hypothetical protein